MKSWKKRVLAGTVAGLMLMGTSAFAAQYTKVEAVPTGDENAPVTVTFENDLVNTDQMTILVYKLGAEGDTTQITDANIAFIDQFAKEDSTSPLQFYIRSGEGFGPGTYKVLMGGTGVAQAMSATFTIDGGSGVVSEIKGVVTTTAPIKDQIENEELELPETKVELITNYNDKEALATAEVVKTAEKDNEFTYTFTGVEDGEYVLKISRPGYLSRYKVINVVDGTATIDALEIYAGNVNGDYVIDGKDSGPLFLALGDWDDDPGYSVTYDFNTDGTIDGQDTGVLFSRLNAKDDYGEENIPGM